MTVSSNNLSGTLSGTTPTLIRTSGGTEYVAIFFRNFSGSSVVLTIFDNTTDDWAIVFDDTLATGEGIEMRGRLGNGRSVYAKSDTADAVAYHLELDDLT